MSIQEEGFMSDQELIDSDGDDEENADENNIPILDPANNPKN